MQNIARLSGSGDHLGNAQQNWSTTLNPENIKNSQLHYFLKVIFFMSLRRKYKKEKTGVDLNIHRTAK